MLPLQVSFILSLWILLILWKIVFNSRNSCIASWRNKTFAISEKEIGEEEKEDSNLPFSALIRHGRTQHTLSRMQTLKGTLHYLTIYLFNYYMQNISIKKCTVLCQGSVEQRRCRDYFIRKTFFSLVYCMCSYMRFWVCMSTHAHVCVNERLTSNNLSLLAVGLFVWDWVSR